MPCPIALALRERVQVCSTMAGLLGCSDGAVSLKHLIKTSRLFVKYRSRYSNVYHCSVYRTGSQWFRRFLSDPHVVRCSGLLYRMDFRRIFSTTEVRDRTVSNEFPFFKPFRKRMILGLYTSYDSYLKIPKPRKYRAFFVTRDPRDIVVSHYFASRRDAAHSKNRLYYEQLSQPASGIPWMIDRLDEMGLFAAQRSWAGVSNDPNVLILHFEDLIGDRQFESFKKLLRHCDIALPDSVLNRLLRKYSFQMLAGGRPPGEEDENSHYRKGVPGDWKNHFSPAHVDKFKATTGDLVTLIGYDW